MIVLAEIVLDVLVFFIGMCIFSFLNVVIYRVPLHMNFIQGRSHCTSCGHALSGLDMIPVFSWIFLGGKCRYCKEKISARYTLVEALGGVVALLCYFEYGWNVKALLTFGFFAVLTVVAFVDIDTMEIPNGFVIAAGICGLVGIPVFSEISLISRLIGVFAVSLPLLLITMVIPGAFGGGDIKLMAACGLMLGWKISLIALFLAVLTGGLYGIWLLARKKAGRKSHFAFGPFLCVGMAVAWLWGERILDWYLRLFGL